MKSEEEQLLLLTKYLMTSREDKIKHADEIFELATQICQLLNSAGVSMGRGMSALLMSITTTAIAMDIDKETVIQAFSLLYDAIEKEEKGQK